MPQRLLLQADLLTINTYLVKTLSLSLESPRGKSQNLPWQIQRTFQGLEHKWWLYVPAQYDGTKPATLMVFQDGEGYMKRDGWWRVPVVLDNLLAKKELPVMAAVFVNPGILHRQEFGRLASRP